MPHNWEAHNIIDIEHPETRKDLDRVVKRWQCVKSSRTKVYVTFSPMRVYLFLNDVEPVPRSTLPYISADELGIW